MDKDGQTDQEELPSGRFILIREARKAMDGEDFEYFEGVRVKAEKVEGVSMETWASYFTTFHNFKTFGLPHGQGWGQELPWVIDFLGYMDNIYQQVQNWQVNNSAAYNPISPGDVYKWQLSALK